jgi:hypothetical protein
MILQIVIMLIVVMLLVIKISVVMLSVMAPFIPGKNLQPNVIFTKKC